MGHVHHPIPDENLFACPKCGNHHFVRVQTGYNQTVPCELLKDRKVAVCHFDEEDLDEIDDGACWSRTLECAKCGHVLTTDDLNGEGTKDEDFVEVDDIDCVSTIEVTKKLVEEHGTFGSVQDH